MQRQAVHLFSTDTSPVVHGTLNDPNTIFSPELTAEGVSTANEYSELPPGGELLDSMSFDMSSWSSTLEETFASVMQSEINLGGIPPQEIGLALNLLPIQAAEIQFLIEYIDQLEQDHTNNNQTNPTVAFSAPGPIPSSQDPSSAAPSTHSLTVPMIRPEHQSFACSWHQHGSDAQCNHVAPNRSAFLRHLGEMHQVSGAPDETIICQLLDSEMGSACKAPIKRGNFPRHADTHYRLRYQCQHCPAGKSFSRQDSWKKHIRTKHATDTSGNMTL